MNTTTTETIRVGEKRTESVNVRAGQITLTKDAFATLLNSVFYPDPDNAGDPHNPFGPYGPGGPVMQRLLWVALNPQPLPPGPDPSAKLLWSAINPQPLPPGPDPYRTASAARALIDRAVAQHQFVEVLGTEQAQRSGELIGIQIREVLDEWCGTSVHGHHGPRPHSLGLHAAAAQFQRATETINNGLLQSVFASAADQLFQTGLSRLDRHAA